MTRRRGGLALVPPLPFPVPDDLPPEIAARITVTSAGCWIAGPPHDRDGYARYGNRGLHRVVYELLVGPIPPGLVTDHRDDWGCTSRACIAPHHLLLVPPVVNTMRGQSPPARNARKIICGHGHQLDVRNTYWRPDGHRDCRACGRRRVAEYKARKRQAQFARAA